jgi:predicted MFS family arabinose efflux permease
MEPPDPRAAGATGYSVFVLVLLTAAYIFNYLDRQLLAALAEPIKHDLQLSDTEFGLLTGTIFALFYAAFGIPAAWIADRSNRVRIVAIACAGWSVFTGLCGMAHSFALLALARVGVSIGEAGGVAPSFSIISDYFPVKRRGVAIAVLTLGIPIGSSLGVAYGAWAATRFGWRTAFTSLTIPGLLLGLALPLLIREPRRGQFDAHPAIAGVSIGSTVKTFLASPSLRAIVASSAICAFVMYIQLAWTPAYLMRVKGMTLSQMGTFYSPCVGISVCAGSILSGIVFDRLLRKTPRAYGLIPAVSVLLALPFFVAGLLIEDWRIAVPLLGICQLLTVMYQVPAVAATQNFISASQRASATAILMFVLNVVALGLGPLFVGGVSDLARARFGHGSLGIAMLAVVPFFVLAAVLSFASSRVRAEPPQSELSSSGPLGRAR